jgi:hypothetical protein
VETPAYQRSSGAWARFAFRPLLRFVRGDTAARFEPRRCLEAAAPLGAGAADDLLSPLVPPQRFSGRQQLGALRQ